MKHSLKITSILLALFLIAQFVGLGILYLYIDPQTTQQTGKIEYKALPIGERPQVEESTSYLPIIITIILGTLILLFLIKKNLDWIWKIWFFIAIFMTMSVSFSVLMPIKAALALGIILAAWKIFSPGVIIQNLTEVFTYGGLAAIFVPIFNLWSISILLVLISLYDAYAVWKSKHMIALAKSQTKSKIFAGLLIPYQSKFNINNKSKTGIKKESRIALLGGGDIGFPLIFAGVVMKEIGLLQSLFIPLFALLGLATLFYFAKEKKFYPAMPFISAGCFIGLAVVYLF